MTEQYDDFQYFGDHTVIGDIIFRNGALRIECCFEKTVLSVFITPRKRNTIFSKAFLAIFCLKFYKQDMTNKTQ